jgi:hypothetical protein
MNVRHEQDSPHSQPPSQGVPAAGQLLNAVLARAGQLDDELLALANRHLGAAPTGSRYVLKLNAAIARAVLDWVQEWPRQSAPS